MIHALHHLLCQIPSAVIQDFARGLKPASCFIHAMKSMLLLAVVVLPSPRTEAAEPSLPPNSNLSATGKFTQPASASPAAMRLTGEQLFWEALQLFAENSPEKQVAARKRLEEAADAGYPHAQATLGQCLLTGSLNFKAAPKKAVVLLRSASEQGNGYSMITLAQCLTQGRGVRRNHEEAITWLERAVSPDADFRRPEPPATAQTTIRQPRVDSVAGAIMLDPVLENKVMGHFLLANLFLQAGQLEKAQSHFVWAAEAEGTKQGYPDAAVQAAIGYAFARGVPRDMAAANRMIELSTALVKRSNALAARAYVDLKIVDDFAVADVEEEAIKAGDLFSINVQKDIAETLGNPKSEYYNPSEARKWYELAANGGDLWSAMDLALMLSRGQLGEPDLVGARKWYRYVSERHTLAAGNYATCLYRGLGGPVDKESAIAIFERFKGSNLICYLGSLGEPPTRPISYEEMQALGEKMATKDAQAAFLQGERHRLGYGTPVNLEKAAKFYDKGIKGGNGAASYEMALLLEGNWQIQEKYRNYKPLDLLEQARAKGVKEAFFALGYRYGAGVGGVLDKQRAEELYTEYLAWYPKNAATINNLAVLVESKAFKAAKRSDNDTYNKLMVEYISLLERSSSLGSALAAENLGRLYSNEYATDHRDFAPVDEEKASSYFLRAADLESSVERHLILASRFERGLGMNSNIREAMYHYRLAAIEGDTSAMQRLTDIYRTGANGEVDLEYALRWSIQLGERGKLNGYLESADLLIELGRFDQAKQLLTQITEGTYDDEALGIAHCRLFEMYSGSWGTENDARRAKKHQKEAQQRGLGDPIAVRGLRLIRRGEYVEAAKELDLAARGNLDSQYLYARAAFEVFKRPGDVEMAVKTMRFLSDNKHYRARLFLGRMTLQGVPGAPTIDEAIKLAKSAQRNYLADSQLLVFELESYRQRQKRN